MKRSSLTKKKKTQKAKFIKDTIHTTDFTKCKKKHCWNKKPNQPLYTLQMTHLINSFFQMYAIIGKKDLSTKEGQGF